MNYYMLAIIIPLLHMSDCSFTYLPESSDIQNITIYMYIHVHTCTYIAV